MLLIYIPLCFYFIPGDQQQQSPCKRIYIPLCFYFIVERLYFQCPKIVFTFHYASTLSVLFFTQIKNVSKFTFHYASTLSNKYEETNGVVYNLHSTMLLLYQVTTADTVAITIFTFHYASTLSNYEENVTQSQLHLHSTMLLLYRF